MLTRLLFFLVACIFFSSKKTGTSPSITGQWEWVKSTGGVGGIVQTPQSTGKTWQLLLKHNHSYTQSGDFVQAGNGTYDLSEFSGSGARYKILNLSGNGTASYRIDFISKDSMGLPGYAIPDGFNHVLVRR